MLRRARNESSAQRNARLRKLRFLRNARLQPETTLVVANIGLRRQIRSSGGRALGQRALLAEERNKHRLELTAQRIDDSVGSQNLWRKAALRVASKRLVTRAPTRDAPAVDERTALRNCPEHCRTTAMTLAGEMQYQRSPGLFLICANRNWQDGYRSWR